MSLRLLMLTPNFDSIESHRPGSGGVGIIVYGLTLALARRGIDIHVVSGRFAETRNLDGLDNVIVHPVSAYPLSPIDPIQDITLLNIALVEEAVRLIQGGTKIDLIHAHDTVAALAAVVLKHLYTRIPLITTLYDTIIGRSFGKLKRNGKYLAELQSWVMESSDHTIATGKFMMDEYRKVFGLPESTIDNIPNGVRRQDFDAEESSQTVQGLSGSRVVLFLGRLVPEKGVQFLIRAAPFVTAEVPEVKFMIVGTGYYQQELMNLVKKLEVEESIVFAGPMSGQRKVSVLREAALVVMPSLYEPFGIVALEAMASKAPLVVFDTDGLSEIVEHNVTGIKVKTGDIEGLASAIVQLLHDKAYSTRLSLKAYESVKSKYDWNLLAARTIVVYERVTKEQKSKLENDSYFW